MCIVSLYCPHYLIFNLHNNNYLFVIFLCTSVLVSTNNCSVDLYNCDYQTTTVFFTLNFSQGWLYSYRLVVFLPFYCFALLLSNTNSLLKVLEVEHSCSRFFENCIATFACCCWFTWNVFNLFVSVYLCRVLNYITLFLFP